MKYASWAASQINRAYQVSIDNFILLYKLVNVFLSFGVFFSADKKPDVYLWTFMPLNLY